MGYSNQPMQELNSATITQNNRGAILSNEIGCG